jgi:hypothetical protein
MKRNAPQKKWHMDNAAMGLCYRCGAQPLLNPRKGKPYYLCERHRQIVKRYYKPAAKPGKKASPRIP